MFFSTFDEYLVFLENLSFPSFSRLIEDARRRIESTRRTLFASHPDSLRPHPPPKKGPIVAAVEKDQGSRPFK